jgi:hypothetical protein
MRGCPLRPSQRRVGITHFLATEIYSWTESPTESGCTTPPTGTTRPGRCQVPRPPLQLLRPQQSSTRRRSSSKIHDSYLVEGSTFRAYLDLPDSRWPRRPGRPGCLRQDDLAAVRLKPGHRRIRHLSAPALPTPGHRRCSTLRMGHHPGGIVHTTVKDLLSIAPDMVHHHITRGCRSAPPR